MRVRVDKKVGDEARDVRRQGRLYARADGNERIRDLPTQESRAVVFLAALTLREHLRVRGYGRPAQAGPVSQRLRGSAVEALPYHRGRSTRQPAG